METTIMGLYWDNGKENGNYYNPIGNLFTPIEENQMEKNMENEMESLPSSYSQQV